LLPLIFGLGRSRRKDIALYLVLLLPALAITLGPPALAVPTLFYSIPFFGAAGLVWLVVASWFVGVTVPEVATPALARWRRAGGWPAFRADAHRSLGTRKAPATLAGLPLPRRVTWGGAATVVALVAAGVAVAVRPPITYAGSSDSGAGLLASDPLRPSSDVRGAIVRSWDITRAVGHTWKVQDGVRVQRRKDGLGLTTTTPRFGYQLIGPTVTLPAGTYSAVLHGAVLDGGLDLGVLDSSKNAWIAQTGYFETQKFGGRVMATDFTLTESTKVELILANWRPHDDSSRWRVETVELARQR
jgi:hypothetical protein